MRKSIAVHPVELIKTWK